MELMMKDFLCCVLGEMTGVQAQRRDIYTDASGINHFTWITEARYQGYDLLSLLPGFMEKFFETGYYEHGPADQWEHDYFAYGNRVKWTFSAATVPWPPRVTGTWRNSYHGHGT